MVNQEEFKEKESMIWFTLSYMKGGEAELWANAYVDRASRRTTGEVGRTSLISWLKTLEARRSREGFGGIRETPTRKEKRSRVFFEVRAAG
jgi:hypothetical protein